MVKPILRSVDETSRVPFSILLLWIINNRPLSRLMTLSIIDPSHSIQSGDGSVEDPRQCLSIEAIEKWFIAPWPLGDPEKFRTFFNFL